MKESVFNLLFFASFLVLFLLVFNLGFVSSDWQSSSTGVITSSQMSGSFLSKDSWKSLTSPDASSNKLTVTYAENLVLDPETRFYSGSRTKNHLDESSSTQYNYETESYETLLYDHHQNYASTYSVNGGCTFHFESGRSDSEPVSETTDLLNCGAYPNYGFFSSNGNDQYAIGSDDLNPSMPYCDAENTQDCIIQADEKICNGVDNTLNIKKTLSLDYSASGDEGYEDSYSTHTKKLDFTGNFNVINYWNLGCAEFFQADSGFYCRVRIDNMEGEPCKDTSLNINAQVYFSDANGNNQDLATGKFTKYKTIRIFADNDNTA